MRAWLQGYRRLFIEWLVITLLLLGFAAIASVRGWLLPLDEQVFDLAIRASQQAIPQDIVLIAIDDDSIAQLGAWPWRRDIHAALIDRLTPDGARAIGLDILLTEAAPDPVSDAVLAESIARSGRVVLPFVREQRFDGGAQALLPIPQLAQAAAALGHIEARLDGDGVMRSYSRFVGAPPAPHLALRVLALAERKIGVAKQSDPTSGGSADDDNQRRIPFLGPAGSFASVSYADVLKGNIPASRFKDKIVLVGAFATGLGDAYAVPATRGRGLMSGVEVIANILAAERSHRSITPMGNMPASLLSIVIALLVMLLLPTMRNRNALLLIGGIVVATILLALGLAQLCHIWWQPAGTLIAALLAYPLWSWRCLEAAQTLIDDELARISSQAAPNALLMARRGLIDRMERIRALRARLDASQQQREETLRFISHDLRAPLASLITLIESVGQKANSEAMLPWLIKIRSRAGRALAMADDFLRLARAESISQKNFVLCCLLAVLDETIDEFWPQARAKNVTISRQFSVGDAEALMMGEASMLQRAFANLLSNAIRHTRHDSTILLSLERVQNDWLVVIADQGPGIAPQDLPQLFGRFHQRPDAAPGGTEGTGLGLLIVRTVIERHGGKVSVHSTLGEGTTFTVELPAAPVAVESGQ